MKMAARAFTGWTTRGVWTNLPYQRHPYEFVYDPDDHDDSEKVFLGHRGRFNGEDIIDIIVSQPATARFIARHLYNYFVPDERQMPAWPIMAPRDGAAVNIVADACLQSRHNMREVLRVLFNSDFPKDESVRFARIKSPVEVVVGTMKLVWDHQVPHPEVDPLVLQASYIGQIIMNPPSVEGWHSGKEWINSGSLVNRINFVANRIGNTSLPWVRSIIDRLSAQSGEMSAGEFADGCLDLMGSLKVSEETRKTLVSHAERGGEFKRGSEEERIAVGNRVAQMLHLWRRLESTSSLKPISG